MASVKSIKLEVDTAPLRALVDLAKASNASLMMIQTYIAEQHAECCGPEANLPLAEKLRVMAMTMTISGMIREYTKQYEDLYSVIMDGGSTNGP